MSDEERTVLEELLTEAWGKYEEAQEMYNEGELDYETALWWRDYWRGEIAILREELSQ